MFFVFQKKHKERSRNILYIFFWGSAVAFPVVLVELASQELLFVPLAAVALMPIIYNFIGIAFVEEIAKYLVVKFKAMRKVWFDEPQDAMLYMITAALGFAAVENIVYVLNFAHDASDVINITLIRAVTATFLHVASSATLGYFIAMGITNPRERRKFLYIGIILASLLHGIYNNFIIRVEIQILSGQSIGTLYAAAITATLLIISGIIIVVVFHKLANKRFNN